MLLGLTGGIGSGKSTVARALQARGLPVYDTDTEAKRLIGTDPAIRRDIIALLGAGAYTAEGYCPAYVAERVFASPRLLEGLNRIVHPAIIRDVQRWHREQTAPHCVVESALLYESGLDRICDLTIAVTAPEELRIQRTLRRDYDLDLPTIATIATIDPIAPIAPINKVRARIRAQKSDAELAQRSDIVLLNDGRVSVDTLADHIISSL